MNPNSSSTCGSNAGPSLGPANQQAASTDAKSRERHSKRAQCTSCSAVQKLDVAQRLALYFMNFARGFQNPRIFRKMEFVSKDQPPKHGASKLKGPIEVKTTLDFQVNV